MDENLEKVKNEMALKYPNKDISIVKYGHSIPVRVYTDYIIIWLNQSGNVRKVDIF